MGTTIKIGNFSVTRFYGGTEKGRSYQIETDHEYEVLTEGEFLELLRELARFASVKDITSTKCKYYDMCKFHGDYQVCFPENCDIYAGLH